MDNPQTLATLGTQVTWGRKQTKQGAIRNGQSTDSGSIGHTSHVRTKTNKARGNQEWTIQRIWQHWAHKSREAENKQNTTTQHRKLKTWTTRTSLKTGDEPGWYWMVTWQFLLLIRHTPFFVKPMKRSTKYEARSTEDNIICKMILFFTSHLLWSIKSIWEKGYFKTKSSTFCCILISFQKTCFFSCVFASDIYIKYSCEMVVWISNRTYLKLVF